MDFNKFERWLAIAIYSIALIGITVYRVGYMNLPDESEGGSTYAQPILALLSQYFISTMVFLSYALSNIWLLGYWDKAKDISRTFLRALYGYLIILVLSLGTTVVMMWEESNHITWWFQFVHQLNQAHLNDIFSVSIDASTRFYLPFVGYAIVKTLIHTLVDKYFSIRKREMLMLKNTLLLLNLWAFALYFFNTTLLGNSLIKGIWVCVIPSLVIQGVLLLYWVYRTDHRRLLLSRYFTVIISTSLICGFATSSYLGFQHGEMILPIFFLFFIGIVIITPISYMLYRQNKESLAQLNLLQGSLSQYQSNLVQLQHQVNPHFLFNALNTLYGIALVEDAPQTADGIQKLGDMMRYLLRENTTEKITLEKEIAYIRHFVALQQLRLASNSDIQMLTSYPDEDQIHDIRVAPMLMIPFVENAFKHGISLQRKSWINLSIQGDAQRVKLDIHNSIHDKLASDPERDNHGIGLDNVKQRLELLYPKKHELSIHQTTSEFFVHLSVYLH
ncbi:histidine kinase [Catalinimonas sp. 4WD22]|uniref:sensor histidine kinase n=1 Tax=Catalinimonas locisalis TaxID=3133978 RepID=UPI003100CC52